MSGLYPIVYKKLFSSVIEKENKAED